jgi:hypothetical protein
MTFNTFRSLQRHGCRFININHFKLIKIQWSILSLYPYYNPIIKVCQNSVKLVNIMINSLYFQINNKKNYLLSVSTGVYNIIQRALCVYWGIKYNTESSPVYWGIKYNTEREGTWHYNATYRYKIYERVYNILRLLWPINCGQDIQGTSDIDPNIDHIMLRSLWQLATTFR